MEPGDNLMSELEAMAVIGRVLGTLPDDTARQRVLRWACERFGIDSIPEASLLADGAAPNAEIAPADDPALKLGSLEDMFEMASPEHDDLAIVDAPPAPPNDAKQPVEVVLRSFVAEFQRFAKEWNGATA